MEPVENKTVMRVLNNASKRPALHFLGLQHIRCSARLYYHAQSFPSLSLSFDERCIVTDNQWKHPAGSAAVKLYVLIS